MAGRAKPFVFFSLEPLSLASANSCKKSLPNTISSSSEKIVLKMTVTRSLCAEMYLKTPKIVA